MAKTKRDTLIGLLGYGGVNPKTTADLINLAAESPYIAGTVQVRSSQQLAARNQVIREFLKSPAEWLLWVDADMLFRPDAYATLRFEAAKHKAKMVAGMCMMWDGKSVAPNDFFFNSDTGTYDPHHVLSRDSFWCDATGTAFVAVHRSIFEKMDAPWHRHYEAHPSSGKQLNHDLAFFVDAKERTGHRVLYVPKADIGHVKEVVFDYDTYIRSLPPGMVK